MNTTNLLKTLDKVINAPMGENAPQANQMPEGLHPNGKPIWLYLHGRYKPAGHNNFLGAPNGDATSNAVAGVVGKRVPELKKALAGLREIAKKEQVLATELKRVASKSPLRYYNDHVEELSRQIAEGKVVKDLEGQGEDAWKGARQAKIDGMKKQLAVLTAGACKLIQPGFEAAFHEARKLLVDEINGEVSRAEAYGIPQRFDSMGAPIVSSVVTTIGAYTRALETRANELKEAPSIWVPVSVLLQGLTEL